jgi:putative membrane protein
MTATATLFAENSHGHWWLWAPFVWTLWLAVAALLFWRFRWGPRQRRGGGEASDMERARGILAERYARGEIDADEYRQRLETLAS